MGIKCFKDNILSLKYHGEIITEDSSTFIKEEIKEEKMPVHLICFVLRISFFHLIRWMTLLVL